MLFTCLFPSILLIWFSLDSLAYINKASQNQIIYSPISAWFFWRICEWCALLSFLFDDVHNFGNFVIEGEITTYQCTINIQIVFFSSVLSTRHMHGRFSDTKWGKKINDVFVRGRHLQHYPLDAVYIMSYHFKS